MNDEVEKPKINKEDFNFNIEMLTILNSNIQSNERLRNNMFALFLALTTVFFGIKGTDNINIDSNVIGLALPAVLWLAGLLFLSAFIRYKEMICRDADLSIIIQKKLYQFRPQLRTRFDNYNQSMKGKKHKFSSVSTTLVIITFIICVIVSSIVLIVLMSFWKEKVNDIDMLGIFIFTFGINFILFRLLGGSKATLTDLPVNK